MGSLQQKKLISYRYGRITIRNRKRLERATCECYGIIRNTFDRLLGDAIHHPSPLAGMQFSEGGLTTVKDGTPFDAPFEPSPASRPVAG